MLNANSTIQNNENPASNACRDSKAEQFPCTGRPFAVWYHLEAESNRHWQVNGENGEACSEFENMVTALNVAAEMGKEWDEEARKQDALRCHTGNTRTTCGEMSALNMEAMDTLNNRLAQVTSILDVLFLAGHPESELLHNPQLIIDALWPARELLEQATEAAGKLRLCERLGVAA